MRKATKARYLGIQAREVRWETEASAPPTPQSLPTDSPNLFHQDVVGKPSPASSLRHLGIQDTHMALYKYQWSHGYGIAIASGMEILKYSVVAVGLCFVKFKISVGLRRVDAKTVVMATSVTA